MTRTTEENVTTVSINYQKYCALPLKAYQFVALFVGIDPNSIVKTDNDFWQNMPVRLTNYSDEQLILFKEYYQAIETWFPSRPMFGSGTWLLGNEQDVNVWLEKMLSETYPSWEAMPKDFIVCARERFLEKCIADQEYQSRFKSLTKKFMPITKSAGETIFGVLFSDYPEELRIAAEIYYQCWHDLPADMRTPTKQDITVYLNKYYPKINAEMLDNIKGNATATLNRIFQCSTPKNISKRPNKTDCIPFKPLKERIQ